MFLNNLATRVALAGSLTFMLFACNSSQTEQKEAKADTVAAPPPVVEKPKEPAGPTVPFNALVIHHGVADFDKWKPVFDGDTAARAQAGLHPIGLARGIDNPNTVVIPFMLDDVAKAKAFSTDPRLKEAMKKGGVTGPPSLKFVQILRMSDSLKQPCDFVEVTHKVKNFDAWLKVFDEEGTAKRLADGLVDGVVARGIDDSSLVYLVFKINDIKAAKAAFANPDRKKVMMKAGVVGKPDVFFGRDLK
jgi:hypothetical protein